MSDSFSVDLSQLTHFTEEVRTIPAALDREMLKAANVVGLAGESIAKQIVAVWQGYTRAGIQAGKATSIASGVSVSITSHAAWSRALEEGRKGFSARPGHVLHFIAKDGTDVFVKSVGPAKAQPFMGPTLDRLAGGIVQEAFDAAIERALQSAFAGAA